MDVTVILHVNIPIKCMHTIQLFICLPSISHFHFIFIAAVDGDVKILYFFSRDTNFNSSIYLAFCWRWWNAERAGTHGTDSIASVKMQSSFHFKGNTECF